MQQEWQRHLLPNGAGDVSFDPTPMTSFPSATAAQRRRSSDPPARPLRCHLLIGPPASGKSTLARHLAALLSGTEEPPPCYISSRDIRAEIFGDRGVFGPWDDISTVMHQRIQEAVCSGAPVIVEATFSRRSWRLAITQKLVLPVPVEWIGWWLRTPRELCQQWNQRRDHSIPEQVIDNHFSLLSDAPFSPSRSEGFAAVVCVEPHHHQPLEPHLQAVLGRLERRISAARNRDARLIPHGYSRLLECERLLHLIQLLSRQPELTATNAQPAADAPAGLAERAAAQLRQQHGPCYADVGAIAADLDWLRQQGFTTAWRVNSEQGKPAPMRAVEPPPWPATQPLSAGGWSALGDRETFCRALTLLRHILHHPFDREEGVAIDHHLAARLQTLSGGRHCWTPRQLHQSITTVLTPYGFRDAAGSGRHGYALGASLLPLPLQVEIHGLLQAHADRLGDPSGQAIARELGTRLQRSGIAIESVPPVRTFFNRSLLAGDQRRGGTLLNTEQAEQLRSAIQQHQRVVFTTLAASHAGVEEIRGWPLQLIFHTSAWYLLFEHDHIGQMEGLLACRRIDQLGLRRIEIGSCRSQPSHAAALRRGETLQHCCGSLEFGGSLQAQQAVCGTPSEQRSMAMGTLQLSCDAAAFALLREEVRRFPAAAVRLSRPLPGDGVPSPPGEQAELLPCSRSSHPYPVEIDLPLWTLERDSDLRRWLYALGGGVRIEAPLTLQREHRHWLQSALAAYPRRREIKKQRVPQRRRAAGATGRRGTVLAAGEP
jgi:predicted kinase